ncbi:MAG: FAD-binding protein [Deltaproteobacteria bacterium]|nr:MAG: FAD-binding protein [Deltaproteobacteria bacterium]
MATGKVFTPIEIGTMTLKHRVVMAPTIHEMCYGGHPTEAYLAITDTYARSGVSMVCVGGATIDPGKSGEVFPNALSIADDECVFGLQRLAETIHAQEAKACQQIYHPGRASARYWAQSDPSWLPWGASAKVPFMAAAKWEITKKGGKWSAVNTMPPAPVREISLEEVEQVVRMHVLAALRAKKAGFDAVNLHFANVTLIMDFISPYTNVRTDGYGGGWENRMRLPCEIVQATRSAVGRGYPLIVRIPADQGLGEVGIRFQDTLRHVVPRLAEAGIDAIDLSAGVLDHTPHKIIPPMYDARGCWLHHSEEVKKVTKLPVIVAGRLCDPRMIAKAVENGQCDVAALSRPLMADPLLPKKMFAGKPDDVRMCVACGYCMSESGWTKYCAINAESAREQTLPKIGPAGRPRKVLVVGGGPGGMEAARVLRERGHDVTLCEKEGQLGGALRVAAAAPLTREWRTFTRWHVRQIGALGVKVLLGTEVTRALVDELAPEVVVVATGSVQSRDIDGADREIVAAEEEVLLKGKAIGRKVVVVGGAFWDVETAINLADQGKEVILVREAETVSMNRLGPIRALPILFGMLQAKNVKPLFSTKVVKIEENGVRVENSVGDSTLLEADAVVLSTARVANRKLLDELRGVSAELHEIGDCVNPRSVADAVYGGRLVGARI